MEMKLDLVLDWTNSKFFLKRIETENFKNSENESQDQTKGSIKNPKNKINK
jgi:hypothetical protein